MNNGRLPLADWIAAVRRELETAAIAQRRRERQAVSAGSPMIVPALNLDSVEIEATLESESSSEAAGGIDVWIVSAEAKKGSAARAQQRIRIHLVPAVPLALGDRGSADDIL